MQKKNGILVLILTGIMIGIFYFFIFQKISHQKDELIINNSEISPSLQTTISEYKEITEIEKQQIKILVPQLIYWASIWQIDTDCATDEINANTSLRKYKETSQSFQTLYKKLKGKLLLGHVTVEFNQLKIYIPELMLLIELDRTDYGLTSNRPKILCELPNDAGKGYKIEFLVSSNPNFEVDNKESKKTIEKVESIINNDLCKYLNNEQNFEIIIPEFFHNDPELYILVNKVKIEGSIGRKVYWLRLNLLNPEIIKQFEPYNYDNDLTRAIEKHQYYKFNMQCNIK